MNHSRLIVVLGVHRSGTSAIARALQVLGADLGKNLMPADEEVNARGYWEDIDLTALNMEIMSALGSDYDRLAPIEPAEIDALLKKGYFPGAVELLRRKVGDSPIFGFKDPRLAILLPFWKAVFSHCQFDPNYVLIVRHPLSVARSLAKRDSYVAEKSHLLWLGHVVMSLSDSAGQRRVLVDYDRLIESPDRELRRVAQQLLLEVDPKELDSYKSEFLDGRLRHSAYDLNDLNRDNRCPALVRDIYAAMLDVATDKIQINDPALQDKIADWVGEFRRMKSSLGLADILSAQKAEGDKKIASLNQTVANLNHTVIGLDEEINSLKASYSWKITRPLRIGRQWLTELLSKKRTRTKAPRPADCTPRSN